MITPVFRTKQQMSWEGSMRDSENHAKEVLPLHHCMIAPTVPVIWTLEALTTPIHDTVVNRYSDSRA